MSSKLFEAINGALLIVCLSMVTFFACNIIFTSTRLGWNRLAYQDVKPAMAMLVFVLGDSLIRGPVWFLRHLVNTHQDVSGYENRVIILTMIGAVLAIVGGACVIRIFSPDILGRWPWAITLIIALTFGIGMAL